MSMDVIDYEIFGDDMQYVEIELDPGEAAIGEAGAMMMMQDGVEMDTVFGDGSQASNCSGFMGKLLGAGKRLITGESLFTTVYHNESQLKRRVAFAAPYPGRIVPINLAEMGGTFICQKDAFLCAARGVSLGIAFQRKLGTALFGGEGFIMQKLEGNGLAFVHAGGTLAERTLGPGEVLRVDTGCVVGFQPSIDFDIQYVGKLKSAIFGGEGLFFATLRGPGKVWMQSLPISRLAGRVLAYAPRAGAGGREEGSLLGILGNVLDGDNR
ncbi:MAG: TIGR00266 family protein [Proteobacteria bacterium]|nr:TIGR00266 family protein [Pseudomonadota bacterium]